MLQMLLSRQRGHPDDMKEVMTSIDLLIYGEQRNHETYRSHDEDSFRHMLAMKLDVIKRINHHSQNNPHTLQA